MKKQFLLFWLMLTGLATVPYCAADDLSEYEIVIHYREGTTIEDRIDFIHKDSKQMVNSFGIPANNPYLFFILLVCILHLTIYHMEV